MDSTGRVLAETFLAAAHRDDAPESFAAALDEAYRRAREAWPELSVEGELFARHLAQHCPKEEPLEPWLATLHAADLYLALACAAGDPKALAAFEAGYVAQVPAYLARVAGSQAFVGEVAQ